MTDQTPTMAPAGPPPPDVDGISAIWWAGLADHRVVVQACPACGRRWAEPVPSCPYCGAVGPTSVEVPGTGAVYSFVRVHRPLTAAMADEVPYTVATVDLDDGGRVIARVEPAEAAAIGARVTPAFVAHDGWTELRFTVDR
jgi:uncharacterized OB-fold protein